MKVFWCVVRWILFLAVIAGAVASFKWVISVDSPDKTAQVIGGMIGSFILVTMIGKMIYWENLFVTCLGFMIILAGWFMCAVVGLGLGYTVAVLFTLTAFSFLALTDSFRNRVLSVAYVWFSVNDDSKNPIGA